MSSETARCVLVIGRGELTIGVSRASPWLTAGTLFAIKGGLTDNTIWYTVVKIPALVVLVGLLTALPWFGSAKRFSLRTLLIATTLVAVVLGLVVAVVRWPAA